MVTKSYLWLGGIVGMLLCSASHAGTISSTIGRTSTC